MTTRQPLPIYFHTRQLAHKPLYEWAMGEKLSHPETSHRAENIYSALSRDPASFVLAEPQPIPLSLVARVHRPELLTLYQTAQSITEGVSLHPSVFPKRHQAQGNPRHLQQAGYFCFDSGTPLTSITWEAALWSASCAQSAALDVESGAHHAAYALCRPPGHHASSDLFGGYCYLNNAGIVARRLRRRCRVAILDIDFHHGNGTQDLFYGDDRVLFVSIHGEPREFYPFFSGYASEIGTGRGKGFTINYPLPRGCDGQEYLTIMRNKVVPAIRSFAPGILIVSAGFDTYKKDPIGNFKLDTPDFFELGEVIRSLSVPTVILQEGGYAVDELGQNVAAFLRAFIS